MHTVLTFKVFNSDGKLWSVVTRLYDYKDIPLQFLRNMFEKQREGGRPRLLEDATEQQLNIFNC